MSKRYYWLKLYDDFFTNKRIKRLRSISGGDTFTIIYLKMQLKALKTDGFLYFDGVLDNFAEELALDLDEKPEDVHLTIQYLLSVGLLESNQEDVYKLTYMDKVIGSEDASAERVRNYRERQKALHCNTNVTEVKRICNVEKEIEKEIEIDTRDRDKRIDYQQIVDMYNETCVSFSQLKSLSDSRKKAIKARLKTYTVEDFQTMFEKAEASDFLKGGNNRNWSATFDWMIKDSNIAKILDGNYDNKTGQAQMNPEQRKMDDFYRMAANWAEGSD